MDNTIPNIAPPYEVMAKRYCEALEGTIELAHMTLLAATTREQKREALRWYESMLRARQSV